MIDQRILLKLPSVTFMFDLFSRFPKTAKRGVAVALLLVLISGFGVRTAAANVFDSHSLKHDGKHEVEQIEEIWRNAVLKGDVKGVDSLLADDYMGITATGTIETREATLANLRSGTPRFTSIVLSERKVRFYGTTALVTSRATVVGTGTTGRDFSGSYRYTHVYARDAQGNWKIVSFEASRIREPGHGKQAEPHHHLE